MPELAYGMLGAAADDPTDRALMFEGTPLQDWGLPAPPAPAQAFVEPHAVSGSDLPADPNPRASPLDWRYELASMPQYQKDELFRYARAEIGANQGDLARQRFLEAATNRLYAAQQYALQTGGKMPTMSDILSGSIPWEGRNVGGRFYYPAITRMRAQGELTPDEQAYWEKMWGDVTGNREAGIPPSNVANYATGNESGRVRSGGAPIVSSGGGERYVIENWTAPYIRAMRGEDPGIPSTSQSTASTYPTSSGSSARPGSSPTVAEGTTGGTMSSLSSPLASALLPYLVTDKRKQDAAELDAMLAQFRMGRPQPAQQDQGYSFTPLPVPGQRRYG